MNADAIKTLTTDALDKFAALLDEGHSERLTTLLKTMVRFHRHSFHNVVLIAMRTRHRRRATPCGLRDFPAVHLAAPRALGAPMAAQYGSGEVMEFERCPDHAVAAVYRTV